MAKDLADVKKEKKALEKRLKEAEKSLKTDSPDKTKAEKYKYDLTVVSVKKSALKEEIALFKREQTRVGIGHKKEIELLTSNHS